MENISFQGEITDTSPEGSADFDFDFDSIMDEALGSDTEAREKQQSEVIGELMDIYGSQEFQYGEHTGPVSTIVDVCPYIHNLLISGAGANEIANVIEPFTAKSPTVEQVIEEETEQPLEVLEIETTPEEQRVREESPTENPAEPREPLQNPAKEVLIEKEALIDSKETAATESIATPKIVRTESTQTQPETLRVAEVQESATKPAPAVQSAPQMEATASSGAEVEVSSAQAATHIVETAGAGTPSETTKITDSTENTPAADIDTPEVTASSPTETRVAEEPVSQPGSQPREVAPLESIRGNEAAITAEGRVTELTPQEGGRTEVSKTEASNEDPLTTEGVVSDYRLPSSEASTTSEDYNEMEPLSNTEVKGGVTPKASFDPEHTSQAEAEPELPPIVLPYVGEIEDFMNNGNLETPEPREDDETSALNDETEGKQWSTELTPIATEYREPRHKEPTSPEEYKELNDLLTEDPYYPLEADGAGQETPEDQVNTLEVDSTEEEGAEVQWSILRADGTNEESAEDQVSIPEDYAHYHRAETSEQNSYAPTTQPDLEADGANINEEITTPDQEHVTPGKVNDLSSALNPDEDSHDFIEALEPVSTLEIVEDVRQYLDIVIDESAEYDPRLFYTATRQVEEGITTLQQATSAEECGHALEAIRNSLIEVLRALGCYEPEATAGYLMDRHTIKELQGLLLQLKQQRKAKDSSQLKATDMPEVMRTLGRGVLDLVLQPRSSATT